MGGIGVQRGGIIIAPPGLSPLPREYCDMTICDLPACLSYYMPNTDAQPRCCGGGGRREEKDARGRVLVALV